MEIRFQCLGKSCNNCCTGGPGGGVLALTSEDLFVLGEDMAQLRPRKGPDGWFAVLAAGEVCPLWNDGCSVYDRRPAQCRAYPAWKGFDAQRLEQEKERCPGLGTGPLVRMTPLTTDRTASFAAMEGA